MADSHQENCTPPLPPLRRPQLAAHLGPSPGTNWHPIAYISATALARMACKGVLVMLRQVISDLCVWCFSLILMFLGLSHNVDGHVFGGQIHWMVKHTWPSKEDHQQMITPLLDGHLF